MLQRLFAAYLELASESGDVSELVACSTGWARRRKLVSLLLLHIANSLRCKNAQAASRPHLGRALEADVGQEEVCGLQRLQGACRRDALVLRDRKVAQEVCEQQRSGR